MGNRATIVFWDGKERFSPAIYLHWNGGPESVYGFLEELDRREVRADQAYECARMVQLIGEFFDQDKAGGLSLGLGNGPAAVDVRQVGLEGALGRVHTDHGDNGFYLVDRTNRNGAGPKVRRFLEECVSREPEWRFELREMPGDQVAAEARAAYSDSYREQLREFYRTLHPAVRA